jgi:hypothetical protein
MYGWKSTLAWHEEKIEWAKQSQPVQVTPSIGVIGAHGSVGGSVVQLQETSSYKFCSHSMVSGFSAPQTPHNPEVFSM